jgi:hypothetical protein
MAKKYNRRSPMIRVNILCEGATEEKFVKEILYPHFLHKGILVTPQNSILKNKCFIKLDFKVREFLEKQIFNKSNSLEFKINKYFKFSIAIDSKRF